MPATPTVILPSMPGAEPLSEAVLFGFDDRAFPFRTYAQIHLISAPPLHGPKPALVLRPGPPGAHDEQVRFYGTVIRIGDTLHMWYNGGHGDKESETGISSREYCLCYATSTDGVHWQKPNLGMVEYAGSRNNNIVPFPDPGRVPANPIIYEPDDPDPQRRFKMVYEAQVGGKIKFCVAFSADGLHWTPYAGNPVGPFFEMAGLAKFHGLYHVTGQTWLDIQRPVYARRLETFVSADFEHWTPSPAMGLERSPDVLGPSMAADLHCYEEIHLGAALWNRGNVLLGIYGQWHGHPSGDRRLLMMDLGLALTHDGLHYHEPIPNFKFILAREQLGSASDHHAALMQGQGMENIGERTLFWYSLWSGTTGSGVRMASWERDRLGMLKAFKPEGGRAISCPVRVLPGGKARVYVNASGLGDHSRLRIGLLDRTFRPIPGYGGDDAAALAADGFRLPVHWKGGDAILPAHEQVALDVRFEGVRAENSSLHAIYITSDNSQ